MATKSKLKLKDGRYKWKDPEGCTHFIEVKSGEGWVSFTLDGEQPESRYRWVDPVETFVDEVQSMNAKLKPCSAAEWRRMLKVKPA